MTGRCWRFLYAERTLENRPVNKNTMSLCCKKVPGSLDRKNEERMIKRKKKVKAEPAEKNEAAAATTNQIPEQKSEEVTAKVARKLNRIPFYPKDWQNSFGLSVAEHKKALETNLADGYIEFSSTR